MNQLARLAVVAVLLAAVPASADVDEQMNEAVELLRAVEANPQSMREKIPRACRVLRRAGKEARGTEQAEPIDTAHKHCRRAMDAINNGNPKHAQQRLRRMIVAIAGPEETE